MFLFNIILIPTMNTNIINMAAFSVISRDSGGKITSIISISRFVLKVLDPFLHICDSTRVKKSKCMD